MLNRLLAAALILFTAQQAMAVEPPLCPWHSAGNTMDKPIPAGHPLMSTRPSSTVAERNCTATDFANDYRSATNNTVNINADHGWSFSFWQATDEDPLVTVQPRGGYDEDQWKELIAAGWNRVRIPMSAYPAGWDVPVSTYRDRHMVVYDPSGTYLTEFFGMVRTETPTAPAWAAKAMRRWMKSSPGYLERYDHNGSTRLCAMSMAHGIIRYEELTRGTHEIKHALTFAYEFPASNVVNNNNSVFPCVRIFDHFKAEAEPRPCMMPLGIRLQFDPAADPVFECRGVDPKYRNSCISIVQAMQKYGIVLVDGGGPAIYAEDLSRKTQKWSDYEATGYALPSNGSAALKHVDWNHLRAIEPVR